MFKTVHHKDHGPQEMYEIDARAAIRGFPDQWSDKPWPASTSTIDDAGDAVTYEAKHRGAGSWSVMDSNGVEVLDKLSKEDAEAFNKLSDPERAEYVAAERKVN